MDVEEEEEEEVLKAAVLFTGEFIPGIASIPRAVLWIGSVRISSGTSSNLDSGFVFVFVV